MTLAFWTIDLLSILRSFGKSLLLFLSRNHASLYITDSYLSFLPVCFTVSFCVPHSLHILTIYNIKYILVNII
jgi:hypothetical protein